MTRTIYLAIRLPQAQKSMKNLEELQLKKEAHSELVEGHPQLPEHNS